MAFHENRIPLRIKFILSMVAFPFLAGGMAAKKRTQKTQLNTPDWLPSASVRSLTSWARWLPMRIRGYFKPLTRGENTMTIQTYRKTTVVEGATAPAPELLDALKAAEKFIGALPKPSVKKDFSGLNHLEQTLKEVRAAIAKATN